MTARATAFGWKPALLAATATIAVAGVLLLGRTHVAALSALPYWSLLATLALLAVVSLAWLLHALAAQLTTTSEALRIARVDLARSEGLAAVATMVTSIAHELNNPITFIAGNIGPLQRYCEFLARVAAELSDGRPRSPAELRSLTHLTDRKDLGFVSSDLARLTTDLGEGARRAQLIIGDLQGLTTAQRRLERVDLRLAAQQTVSLLSARVPPGVRLSAELEPVAVLARSGQLEQVLVNLADNALRAVGDVGQVRLRLTRDRDEAVVRVTDDGPGMTADVKARAFEPFFTTRSAGQGSGLGLAIVASIVQAHGGSVTVESEPGRGTQVEVRLPLERAGDVEVAGGAYALGLQSLASQ